MSDIDERARALAGRASQVVRQVTDAASEASQVAQEVTQLTQAIGRGDVEGAASAVASHLTGGAPLPEVRFDFSSSEAADVQWHVLRAHVVEGLSELYTATIDLTLDERTVETDVLLGSSCTLRLERGSAVRTVLGIAHRVEYLGSLAEKALVRVHVVPALWAFSQRIDSWIFQEMTVPEILQDVLEEGLQRFNRGVNLSLQRTYPVREYCVQYGESDLDFVLRLMKEEGIAFYFSHDGETEELVLVDSNDAFQPCQTLDGGAVPVSGAAGSFSKSESVKGLEWSTQMRPTSAVTRDFDWTRPPLDLTHKVEGQEEEGREQYLYPSELTLSAYNQGERRYTEDDGDARARLFREAQEVGRRLGRGRGNVTGFTPGQTFTLQGHERQDLDQEYLIVRVEHVGEAPEEKMLDAPGEARKDRYSNRFECIPLSVPFRPEAPAPRRRMPGLQTATVVGPSGEEIHTDEHGRIKVLFHWDRKGQRDDRASCWVRVAQVWAGVGFGTLFIPRVGMEVVVDFLEGNPDRPLVIGCVYNGYNVPPYALPSHKTRSTLMSLSTPGGNGFNELRFEDAAGQEEIFLHAQKDLNEFVLNNHKTTVSNNQVNEVSANQTQSVGGDQSESVTGNQTMVVDKNRTVHIKGSQSVTVDGGQGNDGISGSKLNITGDYKLDASNTIDVQAPTHIKLTCGGSSILIEPGKITLMAGGSAQLVLDANALMQSAAASKVFLDANALTQSSGGSNVLLDANALVHASGGAQVLFDANANMVSSGGSQVLLDGNAKVHGAGTATMDAPGTATVQAGTATLAGGGGAVECGGAGVTAAGGSVKVSGGTVDIAGGVVSIN
ncbi:type VI secretion system Vgr family protein [Hyalangium versicolor]|uniref:type VI secretion system Vgr family protein n=1 Tax=Hyalangium versicolor TaxID=2861190 RepID=UPI001CC9C3B0|nr:type VI secretion system tip protein TssI/VgrG [Hyalangium versicolor]